MLNRENAGYALLGVGGLGLWSGWEFGFQDLLVLGIMIMVVGVMLLYLEYRKWYCANCGQRLSQGDRPDRCGRCGSNRVTTNDPGVGEAVRVKDDRGGRRRRR